MEIRRCYPLAVRISAWGAYDSLTFNGVLLKHAMNDAWHYYCDDYADQRHHACHVCVKGSEIKEDNGTYKIHADGKYEKLSDAFLTLEQIQELKRDKNKSTVS